MSIERPSGFGEPITDEEIDRLLGNVTSGEVPKENDLTRALREELDRSLSGVRLERDIGSPDQEIVVTADDIESHPDLVEAIQKTIKRVDFVKNVFVAWQATLVRSSDGKWLVNLPGRDSPLALERVLKGLREEVLIPMVRAQKNKKGEPRESPLSPIE